MAGILTAFKNGPHGHLNTSLLFISCGFSLYPGRTTVGELPVRDEEVCFPIPLPSRPTNDFTVHRIKVLHLPFSEFHPSPDFVRLKVVLIPPRPPPHTHTLSTHGTHAGVVGSCPWKPAWVGGTRGALCERGPGV